MSSHASVSTSAPGRASAPAARPPRAGPRRRLLGACLAAACALAPAIAFASPPVAEWLRAAGLADGELGVVALPVGGGEPLVQHNARAPMNPASTMKLVTTWVALGMLGPEYRWHTRVYLRGELADGTLRGELVLRGGGDPKFVVEDLVALVDRMRAAGLRDLRGDLVLDDAAFDLRGEANGPIDGDASQPYNVAPDGVLMNFKASRLVATPEQRGVRLWFDPELAGVRIDNRVRVVGGPCAGGADALAVDSFDGDAPVVRVSGTYPRACGERGAFVAVLSHRSFDEALFRGVWQAAGGTWTGRARVRRGAGAGEPWIDWTSPRTLADVVRDVNKFSNNVMARSVFLGLGFDADGTATPARARAALAAWLASQRLDMPELAVVNGSGLSRDARVSAMSLATLLVRAADGPLADAFRESLPVVGVDGTMKTRMAGDAVAGRAWIKTGSLEGVRAIAGYVDGASGRRWAVVMIVNGANARAARPAQDEFLRWVRSNG